ncbi:DUF4065 domain-containing protein [Clostridiales bacterium COT073_COT-073]|nr:DUF4065 domain-containing protein [Clostridiales bacterium COT073_COT-073]
MRIDTLAEWFLSKNPQLCGGYIDENTKLNKLLYFSYLMHYAVTGRNLTDDKFEKWDNGPVSREIYKKYRYNNLSRFSDTKVDIEDKDVLEFLEIVNFVYSNKTARELSEETHEHSIWIDAEKNEDIDFSKIAEKEKCLMRNLYATYAGMDFDGMAMEKISGNIYYYDKSNLDMSDEVVSILEKMEPQREPMFVENINGELVFL